MSEGENEDYIISIIRIESEALTQTGENEYEIRSYSDQIDDDELVAGDVNEISITIRNDSSRNFPGATIDAYELRRVDVMGDQGMSYNRGNKIPPLEEGEKASFSSNLPVYIAGPSVLDINATTEAGEHVEIGIPAADGTASLPLRIVDKEMLRITDLLTQIAQDV